MRIPLLLALGLVVAIAPARAGTARRAEFPPTKANVHLEMVFNGDQSDLGAETGVVDQVWGSSSATLPPGMYNSAYIPHSVDNFTNTIAWYQVNHPEWLEYQCDRTTLAFEFQNTTLAPLDVANPAVRVYQWANWIDAKLTAGYQSIAVDTLTLTNDWQRCGHYTVNGQWVQQYTGALDDPAFRNDVLDWESLTYRHVHAQSPSATMQVNFSYNFTQSQADNEQMMSTTDLLFDERGFTDYGNAVNVPTPEEWSTIVAELRFVQSKHICYMTNGEEPELSADITQAERLWVVANYLLVRDGCTYMYMAGRTAQNQQDYGYLITFPEYAVDIGAPKGAMAAAGSAWERLYAKGLVLVNPSDSTARIDLPRGHWVEMNGTAAGHRVTLTKQTAQVLLRAH